MFVCVGGLRNAVVAFSVLKLVEEKRKWMCVDQDQLLRERVVAYSIPTPCNLCCLPPINGYTHIDLDHNVRMRREERRE